MTSPLRRPRRVLAAAAAAALLGLGVAACAGDDEASSGTSAGGASDDSGGSVASAAANPAANSAADSDVAAEAPADELALADTSRRGAAAGSGGSRATPVKQAPEPDLTSSRSLIRTGNVALRSTDVGATLFEVRKVLQRTSGEVAEENTEADDAGEAERALLTVRVPVGQFDTAMDELGALGTGQDGVDLINSNQNTADVSTQVIDVDVRVELQKRSIARISTLLDRATSIRDIVSIERELANREAELGSLQKRQAFLADQTSLSTITISLERPREKEATTEKKAEKDETGFVAGLDNGWDAFKSVTTGLLTGAGALLPFGVVALLVGIPLRVWLRRRQAVPPVGTDTATV